MRNVFVVCIAKGNVKLFRDEKCVSSFEFLDDELADLILAHLRENNYSKEPVAILLSREWVLSTSVSGTASISSELKFQLEEQLPIEAEDMAIGMEAGRDQRLAFVASRQRLSFVQELLAENVRVTWVAPMAVLAMTQFLKTNRGDGDRAFVWCNQSRRDCFIVERGKMIAWQSLSKSLAIPVQISMLNAPVKRTLLKSGSIVGSASDFDEHFEKVAEADIETMSVRFANLALRRNLRSDFNILSQLNEKASSENGLTAQSLVLCGLIVLAFSAAIVFWIAGQNQKALRQTKMDEFGDEYDKRFPDKKSSRQRRRFGLRKSIEKKLQELNAKCEYAEANGNDQAIRQNLIDYLSDLPEPGRGANRRFRIERIAIFADRVESDIELSAKTDPTWIQNQMQRWEVELPTRDRPIKPRTFRIIFRRKAMADSPVIQEKEKGVSP